MKTYKTFALTFFILVIIVLGAISSFNYYIDPLWTFSHAHSSNDVQTVIDERQQKMNQMHFGKFDYDTLLIGSSRTTYINQDDFQDMNVYNFSASDLSFKEYESIIEFAKDEKKGDFNRIIIGVDFFKSSMGQSQEELSLDKYIDQLNEPFYRFKNLISLEVLDYSKKNYRLSKADEIVQLRNYNRKNIAFAKEFNEETIINEMNEKIKKFRSEFFGESYEYNPEFKVILEKLKADNPDTEFIVFTTPISTPLFEALVEEGNFESYEAWLSDIIDVFGSVYNFMYPNPVTNNPINYFDGHHFYPWVGTQIAERISSDNITVDLEEEFGTFVTENNFAEHIKKVASLLP